MALKELFITRASYLFAGVEGKDAGEYAVIGVPMDCTSSFRPGQRFAPREVRLASANIESNGVFVEDLYIEDVPIIDLGDVAVVNGDARATLDRVASVVSEVASEGRRIVVIGGEHLLTYGVTRGLAAAGITPCLVVLDAHFDLRSDYLGAKYSHATVMRRILDEGTTEKIVYVGVRAWEGSEFSYARDSDRVVFFTLGTVKRLGVRNVSSLVLREVSGCEHVYLSIDVDVVDPAYAPGVGNPEPPGLTSWEVLYLASHLAKTSLAGVDLVEISPPYDPAGVTSVLGARILQEVLLSSYTYERTRKAAK